MSAPALFPKGQPTTVEVYGDTVGASRCRDEDCRARIWFAEHVKTGKRGVYSGEPTALTIRTERPSGREIWTVDLELSHFASCPGSAPPCADSSAAGRVEKQGGGKLTVYAWRA